MCGAALILKAKLGAGCEGQDAATQAAGLGAPSAAAEAVAVSLLSPLQQATLGSQGINAQVQPWVLLSGRPEQRLVQWPLRASRTIGRHQLHSHKTASCLLGTF